ncbi:MFS transporter [Oceanibium sediminis]|uniref:MFS transporter n=1 Tax=Oceanibium sediminis TaxID=2026339 RepID=UPI000DD44B83|nr:MFS transporter [Oceanibium sediminis]
MHVDAESRYRWVILAAASAMLAIAMGQLVNGLSTFFEPLEQAEGWRRGQIAFINTAGLVGLAAGGIVMGALADRINIRLVVLTGALSLGLALIAASFATALWQLYALFFLAGALGGGALFAPLFALVGTWFRTGAGLAIGIASAGQAVGQGSAPLANTLLVAEFGWRGALLVIGIGALVTLVPLAFLLRAPQSASTASGAEAPPAAAPLPTPLITTVLSLAVVFCCCLMAVPLMHLLPLIQTCAIPAPEAGGVVFVMMLAAVAGRIAFGRLADMIGALPAYLVASSWQTALVFGFVQLSDLNQFYLFAPIFGFGYAGVMTGLLTTIRTLIPPRSRAGASGIIIAFAWFGHGLGGYMGGAIYDITGTYERSFAIASFAGVANLLLIGTLWWMCRRPAQKQLTGAALPA